VADSPTNLPVRVAQKPVVCSVCGAKALKNDKFCKQCGRAVTTGPLPSEKPVAKPKTGPVAIIICATLILLSAATSPPVLEQVSLSLANPEMIEVANEAGMNEAAQQLFMRQRPELLPDVYDVCSGWFDDSTMATDGCYVTESHRIYIRSMPEQLKGFEYSIAAHEMLHAAYEKLNGTERERIDKLLEEYADTLNDTELEERLQWYEDDMPGSTKSELHSIIPTEFETLPAELERYYDRYFSDRQRVVKHDQQAQAVFTDMEKKLEEFDKRIKEAGRVEQQARTLHAIALYNADKRRTALYAAELSKAEASVDKLEAEKAVLQEEYDGLSAQYAK
jgi:hypothetical protein